MRLTIAPELVTNSNLIWDDFEMTTLAGISEGLTPRRGIYDSVSINLKNRDIAFLTLSFNGRLQNQALLPLSSQRRIRIRHDGIKPLQRQQLIRLLQLLPDVGNGLVFLDRRSCSRQCPGKQSPVEGLDGPCGSRGSK